MLIFSDNRNLTYKFLGNKVELLSDNIPLPDEIKSLYDVSFSSRKVYKYELRNEKYWNYLFLVKDANKSQFDLLVELNSHNQLPDRIVCVAEQGSGFHGFRNRTWDAQSGNLHLSLFFIPQSGFKNIHAGLLIASAASIIETIDSIPGLYGMASAKWVNDILINNSKVAGVITQTSSIGNKITGAMIGIGLNVVTNPVIEKDEFTPRASCLKNYTDSSQCNLEFVFNGLLPNLTKNIMMLSVEEYPNLLKTYCDRSAVIGKTVSVYSDPTDGNSEKIITGKVISINENLELIFEDNTDQIRSGRLVLPE